MKLFLARKDKKLHSLIWALDAEEAAGLDREKGTLLDDSEGIAKLNAFLSVKDPFALITSIASFGSPLSGANSGCVLRNGEIEAEEDIRARGIFEEQNFEEVLKWHQGDAGL